MESVERVLKGTTVHAGQKGRPPGGGSRGLERKPSPPSRRPELRSSPGVRGEKSAGSLPETSSGSRSGAGSSSPRSNLASHRVVAAGPASPRSAEAQLPLEEAPPEPGVPRSLASRPRPLLRLGAGGSEFPVRGGAPLPTLGILRHANALSLSKHLFGNAKIQRGMPSPSRSSGRLGPNYILHVSLSHVAYP